jgi:hypothetical protein
MTILKVRAEKTHSTAITLVSAEISDYLDENSILVSLHRRGST